MAGKLKIYACSGIGTTDTADKTFKYWTDNTSELTNTQAVNTILAYINANYIEVKYQKGLTASEKINRLNDVDIYVVAMLAAKRFADDPKMLQHAGYVISGMINNGDFNFDSLDNSKRDAHLDDLIDKANSLYSDDQYQHEDSEFTRWWEKEVIARNKVGLTGEQQATMRKSLKRQKSGTNDADPAWMQDENISNYLLHAATYFLYMFFTDDQLRRVSPDVKIKRNGQIRTYNYCLQYFVDQYGGKEAMDEIIRAGIIQTYGVMPEDVCEAIVKGEVKISGIGADPVTIGVFTVAEFISILTAVLTFLGGVIAAICTCVAQTNVAKYGALDEKIVNSSVPTPEDWEGLSGGTGTGSVKSWLPLVAIGAGLLFLMKK